MFNFQHTDLPIISKPVYVNFKQRDYSNLFYGLQLIYEITVNSNIECNPLPKNINLDEQKSKPILSRNLNLRGRK